MDRKEVSILVLLDLSVAFDTVDHCLLLKRLHLRYGFSGTILKWISSYLQSITQQVLIGDSPTLHHSNVESLKAVC